MEKRKKKTNISQFSATHTYIKLTFVSFCFLFFVHLSLNIRYEEKENIWYKTVWHNLWLVLTTRFDPKILKVGICRFSRHWPLGPHKLCWPKKILKNCHKLKKFSQVACHLVTTRSEDFALQSKKNLRKKRINLDAKILH